MFIRGEEVWDEPGSGRTFPVVDTPFACINVGCGRIHYLVSHVVVE